VVVTLTRLLAIAVLLLSGCATQDSSKYQQKTEPERIQAWNNLASEYIRLGQYENAKRPLQQALKINADTSISLMLMAFVFQSQEEYRTADKFYRKALGIAPEDSMINNNYGAFLVSRQRYTQACSYLEKAANDPFYVQRIWALENLASCYNRSSETGRAEQTYLQLLRHSPDSPSALVELGSIEYGRQAYGKASSYFERFSSLLRLNQAEHTPNSLYLGLLLARQYNDPGKAASYALLLKNLYPDSLEHQRYKEAR
jgi:type IV pilus assembly protein PilF